MAEESGFKPSHGNWFAIGGPLLGAGATGMVALIVLALASTNFQPTLLFKAAFGVCLTTALVGGYVTFAPFAQWPLPEPSHATKNRWRFAILFVVAAISFAVLWAWKGSAAYSIATPAQWAVVAVFVASAMLLLFKWHPPEETTAQPPAPPWADLMDEAMKEAGEAGRRAQLDDCKQRLAQAQEAMRDIMNERDELATRANAMEEELEGHRMAALSAIAGPKDLIEWRAVVPTALPEPSPVSKIHVASSNPIFRFNLVVGDIQEIAFETGIRIELRALVESEGGLGSPVLAAEVIIDAPGFGRTAVGEYVNPCGFSGYRMPRRAHAWDAGFTVDSLQAFDDSYRVFSLAVHHINAQRGTVVFQALCASWRSPPDYASLFGSQH